MYLFYASKEVLNLRTNFVIVTSTTDNTTKSQTPYHSQYITPKQHSRATRRTLAQLGTNKCPHLRSYLNKIDEVKHPSPLCPHFKSEPHTTTHLFNCTNINAQLQFTDLWTASVEVGHLLVEWRGLPVDRRARMPARWGIPSAVCA